jgi:hypothetical protein
MYVIDPWPQSHLDVILNSDDDVSNARHAEDKAVGGMLNATREMLGAFFRPFNARLARLLRDDRFLWSH